MGQENQAREVVRHTVTSLPVIIPVRLQRHHCLDLQPREAPSHWEGQTMSPTRTKGCRPNPGINLMIDNIHMRLFANLA